jgi:hypothetical protein
LISIQLDSTSLKVFLLFYFILFTFFSSSSGSGILENLENHAQENKTKHSFSFNSEKTVNSSAENHLKNLGIAILPKHFSNRNAINTKFDLIPSQDSDETNFDRVKSSNISRKSSCDNDNNSILMENGVGNGKKNRKVALDDIFDIESPIKLPQIHNEEVKRKEKIFNKTIPVSLIPKTKTDALNIVLLELKRLSISLMDLQKKKIILEVKVRHNILF